MQLFLGNQSFFSDAGEDHLFSRQRQVNDFLGQPSLVSGSVLEERVVHQSCFDLTLICPEFKRRLFEEGKEGCKKSNYVAFFQYYFYSNWMGSINLAVHSLSSAAIDKSLRHQEI